MIPIEKLNKIRTDQNPKRLSPTVVVETEVHENIYSETDADSEDSDSEASNEDLILTVEKDGS